MAPAWCPARYPDAAEDVRSGRFSAAHASVNECGDKKGSVLLLDETIPRHRAALTLLSWAAPQFGMRRRSSRTAGAILGQQPGIVVGGLSARVAIAAAESAAAVMGVGKKRSRHRGRTARRRRRWRGPIEPGDERRLQRTMERHGCRGRRSGYSIGRRCPAIRAPGDLGSKSRLTGVGTKRVIRLVQAALDLTYVARVMSGGAVCQAHTGDGAGGREQTE